MLEVAIPLSKSIVNRLLILQSFHPNPSWSVKENAAEDVQDLSRLLLALKTSRHFVTGLGGTTFRFFILRLSREVGEWTLQVPEKLLQRPQGELKKILEQLGVISHWSKDSVRVVSKGWQKPESALQISLKESSQFASAVLLNAWNLPFDLEIELKDQGLSESYWQMTMELLKKAAMQINLSSKSLKIPAFQEMQKNWNQLLGFSEMDMSSAAAVACLSAVTKNCRLLNVPTESLQPDFIIFDFLQRMGLSVQKETKAVTVTRTLSDLRALTCDLSQSPDLFPVLSVLCTQAEGVSVLRGAPHLRWKESDRIAKVSELLRLMKVQHEVFADGLHIYGSLKAEKTSFVYSCEQDHRLVMAARIVQALGYQIQIENAHVVNKSFPDFMKITKDFIG